MRSRSDVGYATNSSMTINPQLPFGCGYEPNVHLVCDNGNQLSIHAPDSDLRRLPGVGKTAG